MSLRRTAMTRKTELRRTPMTRGLREGHARAARTISRAQANTGPSAAQRQSVAERAQHRCEICWTLLHLAGYGWTGDHSFHHRLPRGMGGSSLASTNSPANLLLLCGSGTSLCHGAVEANREAAYELGYLVKRGQDPAAVPVYVAVPDASVLLTHEGTYEETT